VRSEVVGMRSEEEIRKRLRSEEQLKVYCPKEKRKVPVWWCLGSYVKAKKQCPELLTAQVDYGKNKAWVKCKATIEK